MSKKYNENGVYETFAHVDVVREGCGSHDNCSTTCGRATLAIRETDRGEGVPAVIEIGVAFCSPDEQFSRRTGRAIATGRLNAKRRFYCVVERNPELKLKQQAEIMFQQLLKGKSVVDEKTAAFGWQASYLNSRLTPAIELPWWYSQGA